MSVVPVTGARAAPSALGIAVALVLLASVLVAPEVRAQSDAGPPAAAHDAGSPAIAAPPAPTEPAPVDPAAAVEPATGKKPTPTFEQLRASVGDQDLLSRLMGLLGVLVLIGGALLLSSDRKRVSWKLVGIGTGLQLLFAVLVLKTAAGEALFRVATDAVNRLLSFSVDGSRFIFGNLVDMSVKVTSTSGEPTEYIAQVGAMLAFGVLPTILFFSALTSVLYYLGILQWVVKGMASVMRRTMGTSGAESLSASANIFVGQTEAPLLVRPYLGKMTQSELMAVMTGGFATVAGGVMAVYVGMLRDIFPDIAGHLLAASVMSAPASLVMAKIMVPETETPETMGGASVHTETDDEDANRNVLDAVTRGTTDGLSLALNVGAMLISFVALIAMFNWGVGALGGLAGIEGLSLQRIFGWVLAPMAFLLGVPWDDAVLVGGLMGTKTVVNEFVAYLDLAAALGNGQVAHAKSVVIATYALCGFSNFGSIGIQIGGLSTIAPERRGDLAALGLKAMIAATLACFQTAALAGILL